MSTKSRNCPICQSIETSFFVELNGYPFSKCAACDLVYIDPELPPVSLEPLYNEQGAPEIGERYPYNKIDQRRRRAKIRAFRIAKYFKGMDAIDVGCGGGYMVDAMQNAGANATGIDLDPEAIAFAKANHNPNAAYFCETIEDFLKRGKTFDFGHSSQVIEHVGNFNEFVAGWASLIKPGGHFFLKTPDRNHWRKGEHPETWPTPPHYTQYFSKKNIQILLEKHGFEVVKFHFNFKPAMEILARRR
ncbi:MAG: class I SAM-dependent methyltransferase [Sneathiella sp.]